ncbi:right-handed parallel beta-helix repeat-containing protein [Thermus thermamylovorans]|uniref:Copper-binding protein n=1 Tax=Thermus thermamylovorans TaxID=2509362 RepID=A0A4Q9AZJ0_9DEIN|nr:right-handed parallel beta-helix repeat-containing protein [Thermus thermamylovorans]TBH17590.1 copper-binding protein [Thermus thermamylovorans]
MRPFWGLLPLLAVFGLAAPELRLQGEVEGPLVLTTPGLQVEGEGAVLRGREGHTLALLAPGIRVRGLKVVGAGPEDDFFEPDAAIYLQGCEGCLVEGVVVEGAPTAVRMEDSPGAVIRDLKAVGLGESPGVLVYSSPGARVEGSHLQGFVEGIYVEYSPGMVIRDNLLEGNGRYGFHVMFSWEVVVEGNRSLHNGIGNAVMHGAQNRVVGNLLLGHRAPVAYGLLLQDERGSVAEANRFLGNTLGLVLMDAEGVRVAGNGFAENGTALRITRERGGNSASVEGNAFLGNLYDLLVDDPEAKVEVRGNRYDRASGLPVPHLPTGSFALLLARQPELSLFALSPGVILWEGVEGQVPGLRTVALADPAAERLPREAPLAGPWLALGLLGGWLWWRLRA